MGSGAFGLVWPIAIVYWESWYKYPSDFGTDRPFSTLNHLSLMIEDISLLISVFIIINIAFCLSD